MSYRWRKNPGTGKVEKVEFVSIEKARLEEAKEVVRLLLDKEFMRVAHHSDIAKVAQTTLEKLSEVL